MRKIPPFYTGSYYAERNIERSDIVSLIFDTFI